MATRPPSAAGHRRCEITPRTRAGEHRASLPCWWGGKKSSMRSIDSAASTVWIVESTRWPVSAADIAVCTVSSSRISPIRITSGSWRSTRRRARLKEIVSMPTSRWLITERRSRWTNSIGSSIVTMCAARVELMWSIIAASVVDLPEPVVPVTQHDPRSSSASRARRWAARAPRSCGSGAGSRGRPATRAALAEGVDAEARDARDFVREVDLVLLRELGERPRRRAATAARSRCPRRAVPRRIGRAASSPSTRQSGAEPTFRCRSEPSLWTSSTSAASTSNMPF